MNRRGWVIAGVVVAVLLVVWLGLVNYVNSRKALLRVSVDGSIEQVDFYKDGTDAPVATITTNGQDAEQTLEFDSAQGNSFLTMASPARYYYVARAGDATYTSHPVCCPVGVRLPDGQLTIRSLSEWEVSWADGGDQ